MLEKIMLAAIMTFCLYLFLNLGGNTSDESSLDVNQEVIPRLVERITSFPW